MIGKRKNERGSALVYILIAIALLAALTMTFMQPSSQQGASNLSFKSISEIQAQIDYIRASVDECVLTYPGGDCTINNGTCPADGDPTVTDSNANRRYPIKPDSAHFATPATNRKIKNLRCPGNPGDDENHVSIFGGMSGKFLPPAPALFSDWQWYNETDGVFFWIETDKTDAFLQTAMEKLDNMFAECESDIFLASEADRDMTSTPGQILCPTGSPDSSCFRIWIITRATAKYQINSPEAAAGCP